MITEVMVSRRVLRQLEKAPQRVAAKLLTWVDSVENEGLEEVRKIPGFNDHPLQGKLSGKRAVRLNRQWRAIYEIKSRAGHTIIEFVEVQEIHPHDY